jgi:hypothetical protein
MTRLEDISGEITSPKSCAGGGLPEHWTAIEARKKREMVIRKDERDKMLDKLCKICPFLDERPEICENCVVETVRKELRQSKDGE